VAAAVQDAAARATSRLSYVECGAAFARAGREGRAPKAQIARTVEAFEHAWRDIAIVELDDLIARQAVSIVREHPLRASDAIHLASAQAVAPSGRGVAFACFDRRLWDAAGALGLDRVPASPP